MVGGTTKQSNETLRLPACRQTGFAALARTCSSLVIDFLQYLTN
jgi:hypothetical protein